MLQQRVYLASRSPRRRELLKQIGISFEILLLREDLRRGVDVDETPLANEAPRDYVQRIARAKAANATLQTGRRMLPSYPVLTADTTVALDGRIFGKPADADEAAHMLQALSGRQHQVLTAVAVAGGDDVRTALSESTVEFRELAEDEIRRYIATREPLDKAGAYAIQGRGALFVRNLNGSYSGVMGLPLFETAELLRAFRVAVP
ncbi:MAG TPA: Maf family protein [Burkholderiales bacterium]|jgi:septum formation protein|nr:Maf family protein [Burkholderiales bacterium]